MANSASQKCTEFGLNFSFKRRRGSIRSLFRITKRFKDGFGFVVDEFSKLVHTRKSLCSRHFVPGIYLTSITVSIHDRHSGFAELSRSEKDSTLLLRAS